MTESVEDIVKFNLLLIKNQTMWNYGPDISSRTTNLVEYLVDGIDRGYSSFYTYKKSYNIYKIIKDNLVMSHLSPDPFIRTLARKIEKLEISIPTP